MSKRETDHIMDFDEVLAELNRKPSLYRRVVNFFRFKVRTPRQWFRNIKFFYQRGKRGYADCDTWALDYYLAGVIARSTKSLAEQSLGYPADMTEFEWESHLREISSIFQQYFDQDFSGDMDDELLTQGFEMLRERYVDLWN